MNDGRLTSEDIIVGGTVTYSCMGTPIMAATSVVLFGAYGIVVAMDPADGRGQLVPATAEPVASIPLVGKKEDSIPDRIMDTLNIVPERIAEMRSVAVGHQAPSDKVEMFLGEDRAVTVSIEDVIEVMMRMTGR